MVFSRLHFDMRLLLLPPIATVPLLKTSDQTAILDHLFEPCVSLHTLSVAGLRDRTFASYDDLIRSIGEQLTNLAKSSLTIETQWLDNILGSHPRLGESVIESTQSRREQAQLAEDDNNGEKSLAELNESYEKQFPGLKYVVFVNGRPRPAIMKDMIARIDRGNIACERTDAIKAMCEIASDRARKLQAETYRQD